jgi:xylulokinase
MIRAFLGIDIGTSSSKGVLVDEAGHVLRSATRAHEPSRPAAGHVEMDGELWWREFEDIAAELTEPRDVLVTAVGVSGMGPCVLLTDAAGVPVRPAILYGVDIRAVAQIEQMTAALGADEILRRGGSPLTSQAIGPKLAWVAEHEPDTWARARRLFMPASWLAFRLTGVYGLDYQSASQSSPLFDTEALDWYLPWAERIAPKLELPPLSWPGDRIGEVRKDTAGIPAGTPVIIGTIDAWNEAVSVDAQKPGDLMLMYGTSMFMIATTDRLLRDRSLWSTVGALPGTRNLAGGMSTSGAITAWLRDLSDATYPQLLAEAELSGPGARGLLMLPYFAGERSDPGARGLVAGLRVDHTRGDLYRAALEATALGVRRDIGIMRNAGARIDRVVAVGGGTQGGLWTRIVCDLTQMPQVIPSRTIGASYGTAYLAARLVHPAADIAAWNPPATTIEPDPAVASFAEDRAALFAEAFTVTADISHRLAAETRRPLHEHMKEQ